MKSVTQTRFARRNKPEISIAPLIDMVFILLIFFLVTTSFVRETGVSVQKPKAASAQSLKKTSVLVAVTKDGTVHMEGHRVSLPTVRALVRRQLSVNPDTPVIIVADAAAQMGAVVNVMDECKLAGARNVSIAAKKER
jgi:biopolymer transport protein ExbD